MKRTSILLVDDEDSLLGFMRRNLEVRAFEVHCASNGLEALAIFENAFIDLIILDVMMPNMDGLEALRRIRQVSRVPIIVLSALDEETDKIQALNLGADDYLTKPFGVDELLARVRAVLRRASWAEFDDSQGLLTHGNIVIDLDRHSVHVDGAEIEMTPTEFRLLVYFIQNRNRVLTHQAILRHVWGPEYGQEAEYLRVYVGRLRQKIESNPRKPRYLITQRGIGYCFNS